MSHHTLIEQIDGHVATVTLNRPEMRNAFNETMIAELTQVFRDLSDDKNIRVVVLAGNGLAFCAGADLHWMKKMANFSHAENRSDAAQLAEMLRTVFICAKPVVAKVQGDCYAGGIGLAATCDIVLAAEHANFCLSEAKLGLIPATISPYVIKAMGEQAARRYFLTAERFSAAEAHRLGFVHECVAADALDTKTEAVVQALLANSPNAVREAKRLVRDVAGAPLSADLIADTAERIADIRGSEEGKEGVRAFLEKRKPNWLQ